MLAGFPRSPQATESIASFFVTTEFRLLKNQRHSRESAEDQFPATLILEADSCRLAASRLLIYVVISRRALAPGYSYRAARTGR